MAGRDLPDRAFAEADRRPPRLREHAGLLEPPCDRFPGDGGAGGSRFADAGADAAYLDPRPAVWPAVRCRAKAAPLWRDARRALAEQPLPRPARQRWQVVPLPPAVRPAVA